jgi:hypothetical protein
VLVLVLKMNITSMMHIVGVARFDLN